MHINIGPPGFHVCVIHPICPSSACVRPRVHAVFSCVTTGACTTVSTPYLPHVCQLEGHRLIVAFMPFLGHVDRAHKYIRPMLEVARPHVKVSYRCPAQSPRAVTRHIRFFWGGGVCASELHLRARPAPISDLCQLMLLLHSSATRHSTPSGLWCSVTIHTARSPARVGCMHRTPVKFDPWSAVFLPHPRPACCQEHPEPRWCHPGIVWFGGYD